MQRYCLLSKVLRCQHEEHILFLSFFCLLFISKTFCFALYNYNFWIHVFVFPKLFSWCINFIDEDDIVMTLNQCLISASLCISWVFLKVYTFKWWGHRELFYYFDWYKFCGRLFIMWVGLCVHCALMWELDLWKWLSIATLIVVGVNLGWWL